MKSSDHENAKIMTLFGWTFSQFAIASAEMDEKAECSMQGARETYNFWHSRHSYDPGKSPIILESEINPDFGWASRMFINAMNELYGQKWQKIQ